MVAEKFRAWVKEHRYPLGTIGVVLLFFGFLELLRPYYFLEDQNRNSFLPNMVFAFESVLAGHVPYINYHQFMGAPFLAAGLWGALYPLNYLAVFLSLFATGGYFAAVDIFFILHLVLGAAGMFMFLKRTCRLPDYAAFFGATAWPITGFAVFLGSSWGAYFAPAAGWFPWLLFTAGNLIDRPSYRNMLALLALRVMLVLSGNAQFIFYSCAAEIVFALFYLSRSDIRMSRSVFRVGLWYYCVSFVFTALLTLPVWMPMLQYAIQTADRTVLPYEMFSAGRSNPLLWIWGLVFPFSTDMLSSGGMQRALKMFSAQSGPLIYFLPFFCFVGYGVLFGLWGLVRDFDRTKHEVWLRPVIYSLAILLLWSFGAFDRLLYYVPLLNRQHHGFQILLFANAFIIAAASMGMLHLARRISYRFGQIEMRRIVFYFCAFNLGVSFILFTGLPSRVFSVSAETPPLYEQLERKITDGRFAGFADPSSVTDGYSQHLISYNYATMWGLNNVSGAQPLKPDYASLFPWFAENGLIMNRYFLPEEAASALKRAGVRWYLVNKADTERYAELMKSLSAREYFSDNRRILYEVTDAVPMAYADMGGAGALKLNPDLVGRSEVLPLASEYTPKGVRIKAELSASAMVVANVVIGPLYKVFVDGKRALLVNGPGYFPGVQVPAGKHEVVFEYCEPWFWRGLLFTLAGLLGLVIMSAERFSIAPLRDRFNFRRFARRADFSARRRNFVRRPFVKRRKKA